MLEIVFVVFRDAQDSLLGLVECCVTVGHLFHFSSSESHFLCNISFKAKSNSSGQNKALFVFPVRV
jgi:hypothetical protein